MTDSTGEAWEGRVVMIVDQLIRLLEALKAGDEQPRGLLRFGSAAWGCAVLHFSLWFYSGARVSVPGAGELDFRAVLVLIPIYSSVFGLVVAAGVKKGSLIRHFVYGVFLPTLAYSLAGAMLGR